MSQIVSPAFEGLKCLICGEQAHGQRFGAVSCLPCASFFRQVIVPENEENINEFKNNSKQFLIEMLNKSFNCFNELNVQEKVKYLK
uniref:Nuclear receptor domain-containing protein n=1 Tax=Meloidogyne hapla TaxID=6305 RepID=A0A1I8B1X2_MELHA